MKALDFEANCSTCGRKYKDHSDDEVNECVTSWNKEYIPSLPAILALLSKNYLARKWGQPGQNKKEFAIWPQGLDPIVSTNPVRDFGIFFLINQEKGIKTDDKGTRKEKKVKDAKAIKEKENGKEKEERSHSEGEGTESGVA